MVASGFRCYTSAMSEPKPRRWLIALSTMIATLTAWSAAAQGPSPEPVALAWQAPPDAQCSSGEQIRVQVARLSDQPLTLDDVDSRYRIEAVVTPNAGSWQAVVKTLDLQGRTLRARTVAGRTPNCSSIDVAAAVVISTMLDSLQADLARAQPRRPPPPSAAGHGRGPSLAALAAISSELIPEAWLGGGLALELGDAIKLTFSATAYAPGEQIDARGRGARAWGFHAGAALCPAVVRSNFLDLHVCVGVQGGAALASGVGLTRAGAATVPLALGLAGPKVTLKLSRTFAIQLTTSAAWAFVRPKIVWDIEGEPARSLAGSQIGLLLQMGVTISPW